MHGSTKPTTYVYSNGMSNNNPEEKNETIIENIPVAFQIQLTPMLPK